MESLSFHICFPETPEWSSARVRLCEVTVCKQGQVFAAVFILHWLTRRLSLAKGPSSDTAHLPQVQRWMHRDICSYACWIIYCMSISCKPFAACCFLIYAPSWKDSMALFTYSRTVKIMQTMLCRIDLRISFKGITSSVYMNDLVQCSKVMCLFLYLLSRSRLPVSITVQS